MKTAVIILVLTCLDLSFGEEPLWFPKYHISPKKGWMNDPNGLSYYDGYFHAFYQYNPYDTKPGLAHWGHVRSKDMLNWEDLPIALTPSLPEDIGGCFSGSAVVQNGSLILMYTGVSEDQTHQVQCLATSSDGVTFVKEGTVLEKDGNDANFRDPKLWKQDGTWFVVIGSRTDDDIGEVLLYESPDLHEWESLGVLASSNGSLGYMWECPDFFTLGSKQVLVISPQGIEPMGYDFQNLYQTGYFVGNWEPGCQYQIERTFREIDRGQDFYAAQTFLAPDGRRILIGWMDMWESEFPERSQGWAGMLTLPRELELSPSGDLRIHPIREVFDMRKNNTFNEKTNFVINGSYVQMEENIFSKEIVIEFNVRKCKTNIFGISFAASQVVDSGIQIYINTTEGRLFLDKYYPNYNVAASSRSVPVNLKKPIKLDIFLDHSSIEVFVNDGQAVLSSRMYPDNNERVLGFFGDGGKTLVNTYASWDL